MNNPPPSGAQQFSADGKFWWDGSRWQPALSPDGRWRWSGAQWEPLAKRGRKIGIGGALIIGAAVFLIVWFWLPALINFISVLGR